MQLQLNYACLTQVCILPGTDSQQYSKVHDLTMKMLHHAVTVGISAHELHIIYYVNYSSNFITVHG